MAMTAIAITRGHTSPGIVSYRLITEASHHLRQHAIASDTMTGHCDLTPIDYRAPSSA